MRFPLKRVPSRLPLSLSRLSASEEMATSAEASAAAKVDGRACPKRAAQARSEGVEKVSLPLAEGFFNGSVRARLPERVKFSCFSVASLMERLPLFALKLPLPASVKDRGAFSGGSMFFPSVT